MVVALVRVRLVKVTEEVAVKEPTVRLPIDVEEI